MTKLYVGGLSYKDNDTTLKAAFEKAGKVSSASVVTDRETGSSRGFGFVEMDNADSALKAIAMWNGKELNGRRLTVNEARPDEEKLPRRV
jgi:cold-inducible RNA-binding protein